MNFIFAFLVCGLLCAFFQLIVSVTHWNPQYVLIGSISLGALLMPFGVTAILEEIGGAGMIATFMDAGAAFAGTLCAGFAGNWVSFIIIFCIIVLQIPLGICAGALYAKKHPDEFNVREQGTEVREQGTEVCSS